MRNSISKAVAKLAAAALVAAGVLGLAGTAAAHEIGPVDQEMSVSFLIEVNDTAKIEIAKYNPLTREDLWNGGLAALTAGGVRTDNPGNLGILKVTTTEAGWDVKMTTLYGGKLVYAAPGERDPGLGYHCPAGWTQNPWNSSRCQKTGESDIDAIPDSLPGAMKSLVYTTATSTPDSGYLNDGGSAHDTVQLVVEIGMCNVGADLGPDAVQGAYYSLGAPYPSGYTMYAPVRVDSADLQNSAKYDPVTSEAVTGTVTPVSFADVLADGWSSADEIQGIDWNSLNSTTGFPKPTTPVNGRHVNHFYINVGLNNKRTILENKDLNGTYTETFTFTLTSPLTI